MLASLKHDLLDWAADESLRKMRAGNLPKLAANLYYPNGCPVLGEGPQKDDL